MNTHRRAYATRSDRRRSLRRGVAEFEAILTLGVMLPLAVVLYGLAVRTFISLHNMISALVGWPY